MTEVEVLGMATEDGDFDSGILKMEVCPQGGDLILEVELSRLKEIKGDESVVEAFEIWKFWNKG